MTTKMKVLVTGSEGYIGKHLCAALEKHYIEVHKLDYTIDDKPYSHDYECDIRYQENLKNGLVSMHEYDAVIHLAAMVRVGESVQKPTLYYDTNINGTVNLLKSLKYKTFIFASTGAAADPKSPYGLSKRVAEDIVRELAPSYTIFRFYNVIGTEGFPATNPDGLFYKLTESLETGTFEIYGKDYNTKDGTCVREYIHVMDIVRSLMRAIDTPSTDIQNLAYGDTRTVKEIVDIFKMVNGGNFQVIYKDARPGDLEACYLENPSKYVTRYYTYEQMLKC